MTVVFEEQMTANIKIVTFISFHKLYIYIFVHPDIVYPANPPSDRLLSVTDLAALLNDFNPTESCSAF